MTARSLIPHDLSEAHRLAVASAAFLLLCCSPVAADVAESHTRSGEAAALQQRSRGGSGGGGDQAGGTAVPRGDRPAGGGSTPHGGGSSGGSSTSGGSATGGASSGGSAGTATARGRNSQPTEGHAVERPAAPLGPVVPGGGYYGGYYPWAWGSLGLWGYYGFYDPFWYAAAPPEGGSYISGDGYEGSLKLKVRPRNADVYVDGYYVGQVDDFDGAFQKLKLETGPHRVEIRLEGYEPLSFELNVMLDRTTTYKGELKKLEP